MGLLILLLFAFVIWYCMSSQNTERKSRNRRNYCPLENMSYMEDKASILKPINNDYNDYLLSSGLEKSVIDSHRQFVNDIQQTTNGPSAQTVLSSEIYDNPFVGLRRPDLNIYVDPNARQVTSTEQWQYPGATKYDSTGLF